MSWSLNEVESVARKAARGAGYSWGQAEEAGAAVRWLEARGLPGCASLLALLDLRDQSALRARCPLELGMALCDTGGAGADCRAAQVHLPLLVLPFLVWAAESSGESMTLKCGDWRAVVTPGGQASQNAKIDLPECARIVCLDEGATYPHMLISKLRAYCDLGVIDALGAYAARTYAPATEASRLAGAGAGVSDND